MLVEEELRRLRAWYQFHIEKATTAANDALKLALKEEGENRNDRGFASLLWSRAKGLQANFDVLPSIVRSIGMESSKIRLGAANETCS